MAERYLPGNDNNPGEGEYPGRISNEEVAEPKNAILTRSEDCWLGKAELAAAGEE